MYLVHVFEDHDLGYDRVGLAGGREARVEKVSKLVQVVHLKMYDYITHLN